MQAGPTSDVVRAQELSHATDIIRAAATLCTGTALRRNGSTTKGIE
jgi:hypothetical protein